MMSLFFLNSIDFDDENARRTSGKVVENLFSLNIYVHLNAMQSRAMQCNDVQCNAIKCNRKLELHGEYLILNKKKIYISMYFFY